MRKYICSFTIVILTVFLLLPCQFFVYGDYGYYQIFDNRSDHDIANNEHPSYKVWCEETFEFGSYVYEAYKSIAFIKYVPEMYEFDFWQTPEETIKSKEGDCEDAIFLFLDGLALSQVNAGVVWGWTLDKRTGIEKAHVWCELTARDGEKYIVEGFSGDWNGIIPLKVIEKSEERKSSFKLSCIEFNHLANWYNGWNISVDFDELLIVDGSYITYGEGSITNDIILHKNPDRSTKVYNKKQVSNILVKLNKLFLRIHEGE